MTSQNIANSLNFLTAPNVGVDIETLRADIGQYRKELNDEGIWLFLAALGCWGVNDNLFKMSAYVVAFLIFATRMRERYGDQISFTATSRELERRINEENNLPSNRNRLLSKLFDVQKNQLATAAVLKASKPFLLGWLFFGFSAIYTGYVLR